MDIYKDEFTTTFEDVISFLDFINEVEYNSKWFINKCKNITFHSLSSDTYDLKTLKDTYETKGLSSIVKNTIDNTCLMLKLDDTPYLVRDCALKSILARAKINGTALTKVNTTTLATILNYCMDVSEGDALFRFSEEKISAVHSAKSCDYSILELPKLFSITNDYLQFAYSNCTFIEGAFCHSMTSALWFIEDNELTKSYEDLLKLHKIECENMLPAIRLTSSDVGISSATLFPILLIGSKKLPTIIGKPIKLEHKNKATMEDFEYNLDLLYSSFKSSINKLSELLSINIKNPINCMMGVVKKIGLPKKLSLEAIETFKEQYGNNTCNAYEIYLGICEIIFLMQCSKYSPIQIINAEEMIARALSIRWTDYDTSIELKW